MKALFAAAATAFLLAATAQAQSGPTDPNMKCVDYINLEKQLGTYGKPTGDKDADALDKKINDYCSAHPQAPLSEAMQKAMQ